MPIAIDRLEADLLAPDNSSQVFVIVGDLDAGAADVLDTVLRDAERDAQPVVLQLGGVRFADSTGLAPIAEAVRRCRRAGRRQPEIRSVSDGVRRVYATLGVRWSPQLDLAAWDAAEQNGLRLWQAKN